VVESLGGVEVKPHAAKWVGKNRGNRPRVPKRWGPKFSKLKNFDFGSF